MATINLLDWRQERRERRKKQFQRALIGAALAGAALVFGGLQWIQGSIRYQNARNHFLQQQIVRTNHQIKQINQLQTVKSHLLARMRVIEQLEQSRSHIVHFFDQLVATLPPGIYLNRLNEKGKMTTLRGDADSNSRVSTYLRNLDASPWFTAPDLVVITAKRIDGQRVSEFTLQVQNTSPAQGKKREQRARGGAA